uniref:Uncharacterized protein n=1 Tax=Panagrolaimus superbus TaxID=310955 RepID=A0A914YIS2_9BILA
MVHTSKQCIKNLQLALNCPVTKTDALQYVSYTSIIAQRLKSYMESEMETAWPDTAYEIAEKVVNQFADPKTGILDKEKFFLSAHEIREQVSWSGPDMSPDEV